MKVLAIVQYAYPGVTTVGGADTMIKDLLESLVARGWQASVVVLGKLPYAGTINGVQAYRTKDQGILSRLSSEADVLLTHLGATPVAKAWGKKYGKPVAQLIHNTSTVTQACLGTGCDLAIYNSHWIKNFHESSQSPILMELSGKTGRNLRRRTATEWPSIIVRPPALDPPLTARTEPKGAVTMVNLTKNKNPELMYQLAEAFPKTQFAGVLGGYDVDKQIICQSDNVSIVQHTKNMDAVYSAASVVLVPSRYESYSRVAVEAMRHGVPVIAADTPGLRECLDVTGSVISIDDYRLWYLQLACILDPDEYPEFSALAVQRYKELYGQTPGDLDLLDKTLRELI